MIQLKPEEIDALRACLEVAHPTNSEDQLGGGSEMQTWETADRALTMIEADSSRRGGGAVDISRPATDDKSPKYVIQIDLFNIHSASLISPEGLKGSMQSMVAAAVLNEVKIVQQNTYNRALTSDEALGFLRQIRNSVSVTRVR